MITRKKNYLLKYSLISKHIFLTSVTVISKFDGSQIPFFDISKEFLNLLLKLFL